VLLLVKERREEKCLEIVTHNFKSFYYEDLFVISELCYFLEFKKPSYSVKQGFTEKIDQVMSIFDSSFLCMVLHISSLCMNFWRHARMNVSSLGYWFSFYFRHLMLFLPMIWCTHYIGSLAQAFFSIHTIWGFSSNLFSVFFFHSVICSLFFFNSNLFQQFLFYMAGGFSHFLLDWF